MSKKNTAAKNAAATTKNTAAKSTPAAEPKPKRVNLVTRFRDAVGTKLAVWLRESPRTGKFTVGATMKEIGAKRGKTGCPDEFIGIEAAKEAYAALIETALAHGWPRTERKTAKPREKKQPAFTFDSFPTASAPVDAVTK